MEPTLVTLLWVLLLVVSCTLAAEAIVTAWINRAPFFAPLQNFLERRGVRLPNWQPVPPVSPTMPRRWRCCGPGSCVATPLPLK
jgi:hypothetical protein